MNAEREAVRRRLTSRDERSVSAVGRARLISALGSVKLRRDARAVLPAPLSRAAKKAQSGESGSRSP